MVGEERGDEWRPMAACHWHPRAKARHAPEPRDRPGAATFSMILLRFPKMFHDFPPFS